MKIPLTFLLVAVATTTGTAEDPTPIVRGNDPAQFDLVGLSPEAISIVDGEVRLTGKPMGYFATRQEYRDYTLSFDWKYDRPDDLKAEADFRGNSGLLIHVTRPHKVWPRCVEVQLAQADPGSIFAIGDRPWEVRGVPGAQKAAVRPVGQWNRMVVTARAGAIVCELNGVEIARGEGARPDRGAIGWQSEGHAIRFREIRIRVLP